MDEQKVVKRSGVRKSGSACALASDSCSCRSRSSVNGTVPARTFNVTDASRTLSESRLKYICRTVAHQKHTQRSVLECCCNAGWRQCISRASDMQSLAEGDALSLPLCGWLTKLTLFLCCADRPQTYKAPASTGSAWGKPSFHLQVRLIMCYPCFSLNPFAYAC